MKRYITLGIGILGIVIMPRLASANTIASTTTSYFGAGSGTQTQNLGALTNTNSGTGNQVEYQSYNLGPNTGNVFANIYQDASETILISSTEISSAITAGSFDVTSTIPNLSFPNTYYVTLTRTDGNSGGTADYLAGTFSINGTGGLAIQLNFIYPTSTAETLFNNFALSASNIIGDHNYFVSIQSGLPNTNSNNVTQSQVQTGDTITNNGILVPNKYLILSNASSAGLYADATLYDITNFVTGDNLDNFIVATKNITFQQNLIIQPNGNEQKDNISIINTSGTLSLFINGSSTGYENFVTQNSSTPSGLFNCTPPTNILDWGGGLAYGICYGGNLFFTPAPTVLNGLENELTGSSSFEYLFPFNLYFGIVGGVQNAIQINNVTTTQSLPLNIEGINGQPLTLFRVTSSTLIGALTTATETNSIGQTNGCNTACATTSINNINLVAKMLIWMTTGIKIVGMIIQF